MAKTLIDLDDEYLLAAQEVLQTETKTDTVNAALRVVVAMAAWRRDLQRLATGGPPDLLDEQVMRAAWQRRPGALLANSISSGQIRTNAGRTACGGF